jgi:UPF0755 protein
LKSKKTFVIAALLTVFVLTAGLFLWQREQDRKWRWAKIPMPERLARVPEKWSAKTLAERLEDSKKIRDAPTFLEAAAQANLQGILPGGYLLPAEAGPDDLAKIFAAGPTHKKVTFPEGFTAYQMSARLKKNGFPAALPFQARAYPPGQIISPLEGHLFPDTYWLALKLDDAQIAARLKERYREVAQKLPRPFPIGYQNKPLSLQEVTVLASLVERETDVPGERALVAGVLLKRLREHMRLQCDASVQYAIQRAALAHGDESHQVVLRRHYKFPSPYNTYLNYGLPPGAICNPGQKSLEAAAHPKTTDYLFYVWSPKLKRHRFSKTFAEHQHNIALAKLEKHAP